MSTGYFAPLVTLPVIITEPGAYFTRYGEKVSITSVSNRHDFGCYGHYPDGTHERWHKSGRIFAGSLSENDILSKADD